MTLQTITWNNGKLEILDQTLLPHTTRSVLISGVEDGWHAINKMQVRLGQNQSHCFRLVVGLLAVISGFALRHQVHESSSIVDTACHSHPLLVPDPFSLYSIALIKTFGIVNIYYCITTFYHPVCTHEIYLFYATVQRYE